MPTAMATIEHATQLLDFSQKLDITLLDSVVSCFYMAQGPQVNTYFLFILQILNEQVLEIYSKVPLTEGSFFTSSAKNGRPDLDSTQTAPWRLDESWYYTRVFKQPTDKGTLWATTSAVFRKVVFLGHALNFFFTVFRAPNTRSSHQDPMESSSSRTMWRLVLKVLLRVSQWKFAFFVLWKVIYHEKKNAEEANLKVYFVWFFRHKEIHCRTDNKNFIWRRVAGGVIVFRSLVLFSNI